jgi:hypothetical protein
MIENKLLDFQKEIGVIAKDSKNPHFKNTYASLKQMLSEVKPVLTKFNLVILQPIQEGKVYTNIMDGTTVIAWSCIDLPINLTPQNLGSAITYFRRYTLSSLLALEIDDDDGQAANKSINPVTSSISILMACKTLPELSDVWKTIGTENQKNEMVLNCKNEMKDKLTPNTK